MDATARVIKKVAELAACGAPPTEEMRAALKGEITQMAMALAQYGEVESLKWLFEHTGAPRAATEAAAKGAARSGGAAALEVIANYGYQPGRGEELSHMVVSDAPGAREALTKLCADVEWRATTEYDGETLLMTAILLNNDEAVQWLSAGAWEIPETAWTAAVVVAVMRNEQGYNTLEMLRRCGRLASVPGGLWERAAAMNAPSALKWLGENVAAPSVEDEERLLVTAAGTGSVEVLRQRRERVTRGTAIAMMLQSLQRRRGGVLEWMESEGMMEIAGGEVRVMGQAMSGAQLEMVFSAAAATGMLRLLTRLWPMVTRAAIVNATKVADAGVQWHLEKWSAMLLQLNAGETGGQGQGQGAAPDGPQ